VELTLEQRQAADSVVRHAIEYGLSSLGGYAGTGKTTILSHLQDELHGWKFVAFTGKAASNLRKKGVRASTIHSCIYRPIGNPPYAWELKSKKDVEARGFAIDEASMVGNYLLGDLKSYGLPIIAVGDHGQLPPVADFGSLMVNPDYKLERIHRNAGPIAQFAEMLREGESASEWRGAGVRVIHPHEITIQELVAADQIIASFNTTRRGLNRRIRKHLQRPEHLVVGDRIIILKNNRDYGVYNGQQGVVSWCDLKRLRLDTGQEFKYSMTDMDKYGTTVPIDYAYCVTCHKAQGDEFDNTIVFEEKQTDLWPHNKWTYTAASRAKKFLTWVLYGN
jgi:exodeoxyribonuclease-5